MELHRLRHPGLAAVRPRAALAWLAGLTLLRLVVAGLVPLSADEAYYWVWSRALAPGYLDHPPMAALWIWLGTALAGDGAIGVRLLGPLSAAIGSVLVYRAAGRLGADGLAAAVLLNATLLFGVGAVTMTPDTPLLFFWACGIAALAELIATRDANWWLAVGAACGLALCSKYTALLLPCGIVIWLVWVPGERGWLLRGKFWLAVLLGVALFVPTLLWNARHGWASFAKQGARNLVFAPGRMLGHLGELLGGQAGLATPLVFAVAAAGVWVVARRAWMGRESTATLLAALTLPATAVFVEHALGDRVQANWPAIVYPGAVIAAARLGRRRLCGAAAALGFGLTALVYVQGSFHPLALSRHLDPTLKLAGYAGLAARLRAAQLADGDVFVADETYGDAALLARLMPGCGPVIGVEPRWALFNLPSGAAAMLGQRGVLIRDIRRTDPPDPADWASAVRIGQLARGRGGQVAETYALYRVVGRAAGQASALMPCRSAPN